MAAFGAALRRTAKRLRLTHVTVDPPLETDEGRDLFRDAGWRPADDVQPRRTREVPLGRPEDELWGELRSKWRQYVQKARRSGVVITDGGRDDLEAFYEIFVDTARRTGFIPRTLDSYREVWDAFGPSGAAQLLFARLPGGEAVATLFLLRCGRRVVEPYGGMTPAGAESRANYLLKWEAIRRAAEDGAAVYDMWGLAHAGIEQFKTGFRRPRGELHRRVRPGHAALAARRDRPRAAAVRPAGAAPLRIARGGRGPRRRRRVTSPTPHSLGALIGLLEARGLLRSVLSAGVTSPAGMEVRGVTMDSRSVVPGSLFVAIPGRHVDGHEFAPAAVAAGAVAVMGERAVAGVAVPQLLVRGVRPALALAAAWVHDFPSTRLGVVGDHGHGRQDHDRLAGPRDARGVRLSDGHDRDDRRRGRRAEPGQCGADDDAGVARAPGAPRRHGRCRRSLRGGRVDIARARP